MRGEKLRDKDYFNPYMSDARWQIYASDWSPDLQGVRETQFALGNGYIGSRGVLEEIPRGASPGTFFAGVFDRLGSQVPEIVNAPNPFDLRISAEGEKLDVSAMDILDYRRVLDMRRAMLTRRTIYANAGKQRFSYQSLRFVSLPNKHLAIMRVYLTPLDAPAAFSVISEVDTAIVNQGIVTEGEKKHVNIQEVVKVGDVNYLCVKTFEKATLIAYSTLLEVGRRNRSYYEPRRTFEIQVKRGETICLTKYISMHTSRHLPPSRIKRINVEHVQRAARKGFEALMREQSKAWAIRWKQADIGIAGDPDTERVLRFNLYHLMLMAHDGDDDVGLGAKGLTGEGYRGHSFWDTEIFLLPYYIFNFPKVARNLLLYRYHCLPQSREIALSRGYEGAMFAWESADTGEEVTPEWHKDLDGTIKKISTGQIEHHITADIAFAVHQYYTATGDEDFMLRYGLEIFIGTARFWTSRMTFNQRRGYYEIKGVTGPDEFHENVNNNAYTNSMAQWNLAMAARFFRVLRSREPLAVKKLSERIRLRTGEPEEWRRIAGQVHIPRKLGLIEEFDGYFKRRHLPLPEMDDYFIPVMPDMPAKELERTQYVKQADVAMLLYLRPDEFTASETERNYRYYESRTLHKSSLSPSVYAALGARVNDMIKARRYLMASLVTDLKNVHGNTALGIHAASLGGTWQAVVMGFGGMRISKGRLDFEPRLPAGWKTLSFCLVWQQSPIWVAIDQKQIKLRWETKQKGGSLTIVVNGSHRRLSPNRAISFSYTRTKERKKS